MPKWPVWLVLILVGGTVLLPLVPMMMGSLNTRKLPGLLVIVLFAAAIACLRWRLNPIRERPDQINRWRQQFPTHNEQEIQRFLEVVGESLGVRAEHRCRLNPDDGAAALSQLGSGDSLDIVELMMALEQAYGVDLPDEFLKTCENLGELFGSVSGRGTKRPNPSADNRTDQSKRDPSRNLDGGHGSQTAVQ